DLRALRHLAAEFLEVLDLRMIDVRFELHVDGPEPPVVRQLDREVAVRLPRLPAADPASLAEETGEAGQAVIPVVVAGDGVHVQRAVRIRQRGAVRADEAVLVLLAAGGRIDLVAAEDAELP